MTTSEPFAWPEPANPPKPGTPFFPAKVERRRSGRPTILVCSQCGDEHDRPDLFDKRVEWVGADGKHVQQRTLGRFCRACMTQDSQYDNPSRRSLPPDA